MKDGGGKIGERNGMGPALRQPVPPSDIVVGAFQTPVGVLGDIQFDRPPLAPSGLWLNTLKPVVGNQA